jgi:prepilin-type N-terminal cleavage/methylation domain-containing protein
VKPGSVAGSRQGFTLIELVVAMAIAFVVVLAVGKMMVANQKLWRTAAEKALLQQNVTEVLDHVAGSVRRASSLEIVSTEEFQTWEEGRAVGHTFVLSRENSGNLLRKDGELMTSWNCVRFECLANGDQSTLELTLELEDSSGNRVSGMTRVTLRNTTLAF